MLFTLADRWGEPDPRKLAALPANIITHWQAYFDLLRQEGESPDKPHTPASERTESDDQFADCLRILGNG